MSNMIDDYTWKELSKLLFYGMRPQTGYTDMLVNQNLYSKYNIPQDGYEIIHKYNTDFNRFRNRPQIRVNIPNENLMINGEDLRVGAQPQFYQDYIKSRLGSLYNPEMSLVSANKRLKLMSPNNESPLQTWGVTYGRNKDYYKVPLEGIKRTDTPWQRFTNRIPGEILGMMGRKFMSYPLVQYGDMPLAIGTLIMDNYLNNQQIEKDRQRRLHDMEIQNRLRNKPMVLQGGVEHNVFR